VKIYIGIDLHSSNSYLAVINEFGDRLYNKRISNNPEKIVRAMSFISKLGEIEDVVIESTYNWFWLVETLVNNHYPVTLANPAQIKQYSGMKITTDKTDAFFLAELTRLKILPKCWICPPGDRATRELLRLRLYLVQKKSSMKTSLAQLFSRYTGQRIRGTTIVNMGKDGRKELITYEDALFRAEELVTQIKSLEASIERTEKQALSKLKLKPEFELLTTVPGIGKVLALTIMVETGDISRFAKSGNYTSYCRCVTSCRFSNGKKKGTNNKKNGNKYLSWAYAEAAINTCRYSDGAKAYFDRKVSRTNKMVAYRSLAAKLTKACYNMIKNREVYREEKTFY
jgi:transposase